MDLLQSAGRRGACAFSSRADLVSGASAAARLWGRALAASSEARLARQPGGARGLSCRTARGARAQRGHLATSRLGVTLLAGGAAVVDAADLVRWALPAQPQLAVAATALSVAAARLKLRQEALIDTEAHAAAVPARLTFRLVDAYARGAAHLAAAHTLPVAAHAARARARRASGCVDTRLTWASDHEAVARHRQYQRL